MIPAWAGKDGRAISGLALSGVLMVVVSTGTDIMSDSKTQYLTLSSPRSMFVSQMVGTVMGCIFAPLTFWMFWSAFDIGNFRECQAPGAIISRQMALIGVEGFSVLPKHCLQLCCGFLVFAIVTNLRRDWFLTDSRSIFQFLWYWRFHSSLDSFFGIDMVVGTIIVFIWRKVNKRDVDLMVPAVASGFICAGVLDGPFPSPFSP